MGDERGKGQYETGGREREPAAAARNNPPSLTKTKHESSLGGSSAASPLAARLGHPFMCEDSLDVRPLLLEPSQVQHSRKGGKARASTGGGGRRGGGRGKGLGGGRGGRLGGLAGGVGAASPLGLPRSLCGVQKERATQAQVPSRTYARVKSLCTFNRRGD